MSMPIPEIRWIKEIFVTEVIKHKSFVFPTKTQDLLDAKPNSVQYVWKGVFGDFVE